MEWDRDQFESYFLAPYRSYRVWSGEEKGSSATREKKGARMRSKIPCAQGPQVSRTVLELSL